MISKLASSVLILTFVALASCKSSQLNTSPSVKSGGFKVTILYPDGDGKTFDMDYYENKHMPMVAGFIGKNLRFYEITKGVSGRTPTDKPPYLAIGYFYISDIAEYSKAIGNNREAVIGDFKNYTNIQPVVQISEVRKIGYTSGR